MRNPNRPRQLQIDMLARIIRHQGRRNPIMVACHCRLAAALQLGQLTGG